MEWVLLLVLFISVSYCIGSMLFIKEGSKGITKPYVTASGVKHTAKKSRIDYIV